MREFFAKMADGQKQKENAMTDINNNYLDAASRKAARDLEGFFEAVRSYSKKQKENAMTEYEINLHRQDKIMSAWMWRKQGQTGKPSFENKKKHLWKRCGGKCEYCGKDIIRVTAPCAPLPHNSATIDHRNPRSKGGKNEISNLAMVCLTCNQAKADMGFEEFVAYRKEQERLRGEHYAKIRKDALKVVNIKQIPEFIVADTVNYILARFDLVEKQRVE